MELDLQIDVIGGFCPVQAEGYVNGYSFYFRSRGEKWTFTVARVDTDIFKNPLFTSTERYGREQYAAGWMPLPIAEILIEREAERFLDYLEQTKLTIKTFPVTIAL